PPPQPTLFPYTSSSDLYRGLLTGVVDQHLADARRRQRLGDEPGGLVVVGDDVDLLAAQLGDDHSHAGAARPHAGADGVDAVDVRSEEHTSELQSPYELV